MKAFRALSWLCNPDCKSNPGKLHTGQQGHHGRSLTGKCCSAVLLLCCWPP